MINGNGSRDSQRLSMYISCSIVPGGCCTMDEPAETVQEIDEKKVNENT